jgi:ribonuclease VapC
VIVVDSSAIVAIMRKEPEAESWLQLLDTTAKSYMSAISYVETSMVMIGRKPKADRREVDGILEALHIDVVPVDLHQTALALDSFIKYGKGRHRAGLNLGDCFSYGLAKRKGLPLLFKGEDFLNTDIVPASPM